MLNLEVLPGDPRGQDIRVVTGGHRSEGISMLYIGFGEGITVKAETDNGSTPISVGEPLEAPGFFVYYYHLVASLI